MKAKMEKRGIRRNKAAGGRCFEPRISGYKETKFRIADSCPHFTHSAGNQGARNRTDSRLTESAEERRVREGEYESGNAYGRLET